MKKIEADYLVVGCGLSGSVIARYIAEKLNKKVVILERRNHIGGNMYDYIDEHGILVQKYGPHTFHTKKKYLYDYMCQYEDWEEYKLTCMAEIDGKATPTPFNFQTIDDFYSSEHADKLKQLLQEEFPGQEFETVLNVLKHENTDIRAYAQFLYDKDYSLYTAKQWGISPEEIDPSVLARVPLRFSYDVGYFDDDYQIMPKHSFKTFFDNLLNHPNIQVELGIDALKYLSVNLKDKCICWNNIQCDIPVIYTGALDELFDLKYGKLPYRSLRFEWRYDNIESFQDAPVVAYPQAEGYTRITEYKKIPVQKVQGTSYAVEYPLKYDSAEAEPYYPILTQDSQQQYAEYLILAEQIPNLYLCGRLADFKYYNMDQALDRALEICNNIEMIGESMDNIKIFVSHRIDLNSATVDNPLYLPVRCGAVFDKNTAPNIIGDNTGEHISERRMSFCEFTVQYWAWKNVKADYYGLCHYRRYLSFADKQWEADERNMINIPYLSSGMMHKFGLDQPNKMRNIIEQYDALILAGSDVTKVYTPQGFKDTVWDHWAAHDAVLIYAKDMQILLDLIGELHPEYLSSANAYFKQKYHIGYNCFVMKDILFDEMCKFQFDILFEFEKRVDMSSYEGVLERTPGFMGEILYGIYMYHLQQSGKYKIKEMQLLYFAETRKIENNLQGKLLYLKSNGKFCVKKYANWILPKGTKRREKVKILVRPFRK